jgi:hypothetical protein
MVNDRFVGTRNSAIVVASSPPARCFPCVRSGTEPVNLLFSPTPKFGGQRAILAALALTNAYEASGSTLA